MTLRISAIEDNKYRILSKLSRSSCAHPILATWIIPQPEQQQPTQNNRDPKTRRKNSSIFRMSETARCALAMIIAFKSSPKKNNINFGYPEMENYYYYVAQVSKLKKSECRTPASDIICTAHLDKFILFGFLLHSQDMVIPERELHVCWFVRTKGSAAKIKWTLNWC